MRCLLSLVCLLLVSPVVAETPEANKKMPKAEDFLGKWSGKWDDRFIVQFTITQNAKTKDLDVLYEWEEMKGAALQQQQRTGVLEGDILRIGKKIELTLSSKDPAKATALGKFPKPRTAKLTRELPREA